MNRFLLIYSPSCIAGTWIGTLRAACADVVHVYAECELPTVWGPSDKVAADGCLIPTWDDNIQTSYHIRYGKTGGVAYRHVGADYIAYFTHFILAGAYEGTYLINALFNNPSTVKATGVYSDTHGQSAALFALPRRTQWSDYGHNSTKRIGWARNRRHLIHRKAANYHA